LRPANDAHNFACADHQHLSDLVRIHFGDDVVNG
jgi:hypothetical protein